MLLLTGPAPPARTPASPGSAAPAPLPASLRRGGAPGAAAAAAAAGAARGAAEMSEMAEGEASPAPKGKQPLTRSAEDPVSVGVHGDDATAAAELSPARPALRGAVEKQIES